VKKDRPFIVRALLDELPLKLVSLAIAVTLFVIVRGDQDASTGVTVKVMYALPSDRVLVSEPPAQVKVGLRGRWTRLSHLDERDVDPIRIDLSTVDDGELRLRDDMIHVPAGVRVSSISPAEVMLRFEPRDEKEVQLVAVLDGDPAEGYRIGRVRAIPDKVRVDGARSALHALQHVKTLPLDIDGADGTVRTEVGLASPGPYLRILGRDRVTIEAEITPQVIERTLDGVPLANAPRPLPAGVTVVLRGAERTIKGITQRDLKLEWDPAAVSPQGGKRGAIKVVGLPEGVTAEVKPTPALAARRR
jgi:YbbR domain-containing protein